MISEGYFFNPDSDFNLAFPETEIPLIESKIMPRNQVWVVRDGRVKEVIELVPLPKKDPTSR